MNLMNAVGKISDEHIAEFAHVSPKKFYVAPWMKIAAAAACVAVIVTAVPLIGKTISSKPAFSLPSYIITDCWAAPDNENNARVVFNGVKYLFDNDDLSRIPKQLREDYKLVGEVLTVDPENSETDGYSLGCNVGDPIYMDPDCKGEIYVFTRSVTGDFGYVRFTDCVTHETLEDLLQNIIPQIFGYTLYNNKYYFNTENEYSYELPDRYVLVYTDDNGVEYFQDPDRPEEIYDCFLDYEHNRCLYYRLIDFEAHRQEGKIIHGKLRPFFDNLLEFKKSTGSESSIQNSEKIDMSSIPQSVLENIVRSGIPFVILNGKIYVSESSDYDEIDELPEGFRWKGEVMSTAVSDFGYEGFAQGFFEGDEIYQNPDIPGEIYVFTLHSSSKKWYSHYIRLYELQIIDGCDLKVD